MRARSIFTAFVVVIAVGSVVAGTETTALAKPRWRKTTTTTTVVTATTTTSQATTTTTVPTTATTPPPVSSDCNRYASTSGSDSNSGTLELPYRSVGKLVGTLTAGQTGCLLGGNFAGNVSIRNGGQPGSPITLTSAPGYRATIAGVLWVADSANDVTIADLNLNGANSNATPSPQVNGDRVTLRGNDITNQHTGICILLGGSFVHYGRADGAVVEGNRVHNCGRLPQTNHDHGIYVEAARGTRIVSNWFYDNADWGIHLYPDADATYIAYNIIDGNGKGVIFAGERSGGEYSSSYSSDNNIVELNIVSNPSIGSNIESWWGGPVGVGNVARSNCMWKAGSSGLDLSGGGFSADSNVTADPLYVNRAAKDFRLQAGSPCAAMAPLS